MVSMLTRHCRSGPSDCLARHACQRRQHLSCCTQCPVILAEPQGAPKSAGNMSRSSFCRQWGGDEQTSGNCWVRASRQC